MFGGWETVFWFRLNEHVFGQKQCYIHKYGVFVTNIVLLLHSLYKFLNLLTFTPGRTLVDGGCDYTRGVHFGLVNFCLFKCLFLVWLKRCVSSYLKYLRFSNPVAENKLKNCHNGAHDAFFRSSQINYKICDFVFLFSSSLCFLASRSTCRILRPTLGFS